VQLSTDSGKLAFIHSFIHSFIHTYFPFLFTAKNSRLRKRLSLEFEQTGRVTWIVVPPPCQSIFSPHLCQIENVLPSGAGRKSTLIEGKVKVKGKKEFTCRPIGRATLALDRGRIWYGAGHLKSALMGNSFCLHNTHK